MKHWPSQVFPLTLLALLAGLTFWLQSTIDPDLPPSDSKARHDPDAIAENFVVRRFDEQGLLRYRLTAPYMAHFPDNDSSTIRQPRLQAFRPGAPTLTLQADEADVSGKGETVQLHRNVLLTRAGQAGGPPLIARMPELTLYPEQGLAHTRSPVHITQGASWLKGVGMQVDQKASSFVLLSDVQGAYLRAPSSP
ncbi:MAG: LPS export ABC transporter periplasmic protein LptC [Dechloromonas sp.]|nr:LPS export ABC transporter periplasmic protein LptC [Dechloromonas sp.]